MNFKLGNKKLAIFIIVIASLLIIGGVFWWWENREPDIGLVRSEEFNQRETKEGKIIEHEETGLKVRIPANWEITDSGDSLLCTSLDFQLHPVVGPYGPPIPEKGCIIEISIKKEIESSSYDIEYSYLQESIELCSESSEYDCDYEVMEIGENKALKYIYSPDNQSIPGSYVWVKVPKNEKIYIFEPYLFGQDREKCAQEFDKIIQTIEIKK